MLEADQPFLHVQLGGPANLKCCFSSNRSVTATWIRFVTLNTTLVHHFFNSSRLEKPRGTGKDGIKCSALSLESAQLSDSGLYRCLLEERKLQMLSHGTLLLVSGKEFRMAGSLAWLC